MRTCARWGGVPLSVLRGEVTPGSPWRDTDRLLALALEKHERGIHHRCGQPLQFSTDADASGHYDRNGIVCYACAALDRQERADAKNSTQAPPGRITWASPDAAVRHAMEYPLPDQYGEAPPT